LGFPPAVEHEEQQDRGEARNNSNNPTARTLLGQPHHRPHASARRRNPEQLLKPRIAAVANGHRPTTFGGRRTARAK
jgi:hypothetical protein